MRVCAHVCANGRQHIAQHTRAAHRPYTRIYIYTHEYSTTEPRSVRVLARTVRTVPRHAHHVRASPLKAVSASCCNSHTALPAISHAGKSSRRFSDAIRDRGKVEK